MRPLRAAAGVYAACLLAWGFAPAHGQAGAGRASAADALWVDRPLVHIEVTGLRKTRPSVVRREITHQPGQPLEWSRADRDRLRLLDLGLFAEVRIEAERDSATHRPVLRYAFLERPTLVALPRLEYDPEDRWTYGAFFADQSFLGRGESLSMSASMGGRTGVAVGYGVPWIAGRRLGAGTSVFWRKRKKRSEDIHEERQGAGLGVFPSLGYETRFGISGGGEVVRTKPLDPEDPMAPPREKDDHRWMTLAASRNTRDYRYQPSRGQVLSAAWTQHGGPLGGTTDFHRFSVNAMQVFRTSDRSALSLASRILWSEGTVPRYLRTSLGGINTLRGYQQGEFAGESRWVGWLEQRLPVLAKRTVSIWNDRYQLDYTIDAVVFADVGTIWEGDDLLRGQAKARWGGGVGLRFIVPLAQVFRLDVATNGRDVRVYAAGGLRL